MLAMVILPLSRAPIMATWTFFKCLAKSVVFKGTLPAIKFALSSCTDANHLVNAIPEVAEATYDCFCKSKSEPERVAEVEAMAPADLPEARRQAAQAADETAPALPAEDREALVAYLALVPATVRRSLRRPNDPSGKTVPSGLAIRKATDVVPFLPTRMPRFEAGDQPLAEVDLELEDLLGVGGFGEVWRARNPHTGVPVALKFTIDESAAASLRKEAQLLGKVIREGHHPGIVQLLHTYLRADPPCLEYELVEGGDLAGLIQEWHRSPTPPTPRQAARVILRLAEAVGFAHSKGITHRDLKPSNCLVRRRGSGEIEIKVADFGIGGLAAGEAIRETSRGGGQGRMAVETVRGAYTPLYAPPEQMRGGPPDRRDDVYALGVIWLQLLTGDLSRGAPSGDGWRRRLAGRGVDESTIRILTSCFEDPEDRPSDAGVLAAELKRLAGDGPVQASVPVQPPGLAPPPVPAPPPVSAPPSVIIECPSCRRRLRTSSQLHPGKVVRCPGCGESFVPGGKTIPSPVVASVQTSRSLRVSEELDAYLRHFDARRMGGVHVAPHTLESAALWAVLTRLEPPGQEGVTILDKLRLYDGQRVPGFIEDHVRALRGGSPGEGAAGVSTGYAIEKIEEALSNARQAGYLGAFMVLNALEKGIERPVPVGSPKVVGHCRDMMVLVRRELEMALVADVEAAIPEPSADSLASRCSGFIEHVKAYTQREKVRNRVSGVYEDPDEKLMRLVEERMDILEARKDDFRRELMNSIVFLALDGKRFTYETNQKLHQTLVRVLKDEWGESITQASLATEPPSVDVREKVQAVKALLVSERGFADASATEALGVWARAKARQTGTGSKGADDAAVVPCPRCRNAFAVACSLATFGEVRCPDCCVAFAPCRPEKVRYATRLRDEVRCYERAVAPRLGGVHLAPHTLEMAALWAVMTRLDPPRQQGVSLSQKAKLYDGQRVPGLGEADVAALRHAAPGEGTFGVPPDYVLGRIVAALEAHPAEKCLRFCMVLHEVEAGLDGLQVADGETLCRSRELLVAVRGEFEKVVADEVGRAVTLDEDSLERLCSRYVDNARGYVQREKIRNRYTGTFEDPDERLLRSVEEKIDVPEAGKDRFRGVIMDQVGDCAIALRKFTSTTNPGLRLALELKLHEDSGDAARLTVSRLGSRAADSAGQEKLEAVKLRLIRDHGYCEVCAGDAVVFVASVIDRGARESSATG